MTDALEMEVLNDETPIELDIDFDGEYIYGELIDEIVAQAIKQYFEENDILNKPPAKISEVLLTADGWIGDETPYSQIVEVRGATENSQVDLTPSEEQLAIFYEKDLTFVTKNNGGVITVYAIGQKPQNDYVIQVTITEVAYE